MIHCMIKSCKISGNIPGITYHMIPFKYAKQWFPDLQGTVGQIIADHIVVCSLHFTPGDFMKTSQVKTEPTEPTEPAIESSSGNNITLQLQPLLVLQQIIPPPTDYVYVLPDEKLKQIINGESSSFTNENFVERINSGIRNGNINIDPISCTNIKQETIEEEEIINDNSLVFTHDDFLDRTHYVRNENIQYNTYSKQETIEEQNRIIKDIHNYSVTPGKEEWLATRNVIRTIKKDIKCAQQKNRRLETRFSRLKKEYAELKNKKK